MSDICIYWKERKQTMKPPVKKYKITYKMVLKHRTVIIDAASKYDAKSKFYNKFPSYEIVKIEVIEA